jgi:peptide/nickel transport system permease protein
MTAAWRDRRGRVGLALLLGVLITAIAAPLVTGGDPNAPADVVATRFLAPFTRDVHGVVHPLGTDRFGRDVWTRLAYGGRISLAVGVLSMVLSVAVGTAIGAVAGWWRGWVGTLLTGFTDFALALPRVVLLLLLAALWRQCQSGRPAPGATGWMPVARLVRRGARAAPTVRGRRRSSRRAHALGAVAHVSQCADAGDRRRRTRVGNAILPRPVSLSGLGVQPPTPSGAMRSLGQDHPGERAVVATAPA